MIEVEPTAVPLERRRKLLPKWIRVFTWIFLIFGFLAPIALVFGLFNLNFHVALYGLETVDVFSYLGLSIVFLFAFKGFVAYSLWYEEDWAINAATVDAILGIFICLFVTFVLPFIADSDNGGFKFSFRLELFLLIPYLRKMRKIKSEWESR